MVLHETVCLRQLAGGNHSEEIRFGRFLRNEAVTVERLIEGWSDRTRFAVEGRHVLALQDTSELKFPTTEDNRRDLGKVKKGSCWGLLLHAMLALDAQSGCCLGLVGGKVWTRGTEELSPHNKRPLSEKKSRRWVETAEPAKPILALATMVTFISDREGDFFVMWGRVPEGNFHLLVRVMHDHALTTGGTLRKAAQKVAFLDTQVIELRERADRPHARPSFACATARPRSSGRATCVRTDMPDGVELHWVEVIEQSAPAGVEPLHWSS